jgi:hypothetical protein
MDPILSIEVRSLMHSLQGGLANVYREHIARCHRVYQCPRCHLGFLQEEKLVAHYSSPDCFPRDEIRIFGINDKMFQLVVYGRLKGRTPDEKWKELYSKIFPEVPQESLPSPCESRMKFRIFVL